MLNMVVHAYNPSIQEAVAGESQVPDQPGLHNETLSQKPPCQKKSVLYFKHVASRSTSI
jgi:hypothetical protein